MGDGCWARWSDVMDFFGGGALMAAARPLLSCGCGKTT
jgi:hypothetical protein